MARAILYVDPTFLVESAKAGKHHVEVVQNALPDDAAYVGLWLRGLGFTGVYPDAIGLILESAQFPAEESSGKFSELPSPVWSLVAEDVDG